MDDSFGCSVSTHHMRETDRKRNDSPYFEGRNYKGKKETIMRKTQNKDMNEAGLYPCALSFLLWFFKKQKLS